MSPFGRGLDELPPYVDLVTLRAGDCVDMFARNWQGLHVPITTMNPAELWRAYRKWKPRVAA